MKHYLFTYGMLTNTNIMDDGAVSLGAAIIDDWQFEMLTFANVKPKSGSQAEGVLWEINDEILESCDWREGYPSLYNRQEVTATLRNGETRSCWVYTLTESGRSSYVKGSASLHYVTTVTEGYLQHGVSIEQLTRA